MNIKKKSQLKISNDILQHFAKKKQLDTTSNENVIAVAKELNSTY